jgi:hypothetical protein
MTPRRGSALTVALTAAGVTVALMVITLAARTGPHSLVNGKLRDPSLLRPVSRPPKIRITTSGRHGGQAAPSHAGTFLHLLGDVVRIAIIVLVAVALLRLALWILQGVRARLRSAPAEDPRDFDVLDPDDLAETMREDADEQLRRLLEGSPRNAIVACWNRFEDQAERVGVARKDWETSSEFTLRLLDAVRADPAAVSRLERLYREARFSAHDIDESRRDSAVEALEAIHASLRPPAGVR